MEMMNTAPAPVRADDATPITGQLVSGDNVTVRASVPNAVRHEELINLWLGSYKSENSRKAYRRDLASFLRCLDAVRVDVLAVKRAHVDAWARQLEQDGASSATVARRLSAVSSFYNYAAGEDAIGGNPVARVKRPQINADHSETRGLDVDQARSLFQAATADSPRSGALVALLLGQGLRIGEALSAMRSDYGQDAGRRVLTITRKGGNRQRVELAPMAVAALDAYTGPTGQEVATGREDDALIFTTSTGKPWAHSEAYRTVQRLAKLALGEETGARITPHSLRHTYATLALDKGVQLHKVQDHLGHADPRTTRRYDRARGRLDGSGVVVGNLFA
ncbi:tyrosine-type recombinase/integrase [Zhihengliuella halotolerans]|uniref:tyrosine-type recombinase/integrase n=1 Tax=Zhihengliuella halotolerans TaxID=370736 RepID=UPI0015E14C64|nr:tyrosine-type recombinase/integrase [Zhihengliuella halotolerans]